MGLLDVLKGMQHEPRGARQAGSSGGGMSPLTMALLGLLAYKALKDRGGLGNVFGGGQAQGRGTTRAPAELPPSSGGSAGGLGDILGGLFGGRAAGAAPGPGTGGGLSDLIPGGLGGLLGGAAAGSILSGGLGNLVRDLQTSGQGKAAQSWVGTGPNEDIAPGDLANALGSDTIDTLSRQTGMGRDELLTGLSQQLPGFVDQLTPEGRLPTEEEAEQMV